MAMQGWSSYARMRRHLPGCSATRAVPNGASSWRSVWRVSLRRPTDGYRVRLLATVASLQDVEDALVAGAEGIGLVRTELLVLQRRGVPGEEEQYAWYRQLCQGMGEAPVTIRLFDLGAEWREAIPVLERNPALGMRGIRYMLHHPELLRAQLRAILRVAAEGFTLRLLLPLVNSAEEVRTVRQMLRGVGARIGLPRTAACAREHGGDTRRRHSVRRSWRRCPIS
jgi:phosphoenolpyruvate-protein kinase (PTS system EI component)